MAPNIVRRAREGRHAPTDAERKLWSLLRGRRLGQAKFRRQHPIGPYVVDFACLAQRLVIEVDGLSHIQPEQAAFDAQRTAFLQNAGWRVLRIPNDEVYVALGVVEAKIHEALYG